MSVRRGACLSLATALIVMSSLVTISGLTTTAADASPATFTGASIDSERGAIVNPLSNATYADSFSASQFSQVVDNSNVIGFSLGGPYPGPNYWGLVFAAPEQGVIEPGTYDNAQRESIGLLQAMPGLDVTSAIGCNQEFGQFNVLDVTYSSPGVLASFAATFEDHCEGQGPATFGDISYNSSAPFYGEALSSDNVEVDAAGEYPGASGFTVTNTGQSSLNITGGYFSGPGASDFFVADSTCAAALAPGAVCEIDIGYQPTSDMASANATYSFYDQLATNGPPGAAATSGTGRDVSLVGDSFDGYYEVHATGAVDPFGDAPDQGEPSGALNKPIVGMTATPDGGGYWLVASDGGIFSYGDAQFYGSTGGMHLNKPIVGMAPTADGGGYWLVASDGGIFSFGDAMFHGSSGGFHLNKPIVGMTATPDGGGYWLVASDGGIFSFGEAQFYGSTGGMHLNKPIVGMSSSIDGSGYWLVASDGGIFSFGGAQFHGSSGNIKLNRPIVGMAASPDGGGYWLVASDGGIFSYGDAPFLGSSGSSGRQDVVGMSASLLSSGWAAVSTHRSLH
jgi:hypothetical protein